MKELEKHSATGKLLSMKDELRGTGALNWHEDTPVEEWDGVTLDSRGCVESLVLSSMNLDGVIPEAIAMLPSLERLDLSANQLTGGIPSSLGNLENLNQLMLQDNKLTGHRPTSSPAASRRRWGFLRRSAVYPC